MESWNEVTFLLVNFRAVFDLFQEPYYRNSVCNGLLLILTIRVAGLFSYHGYDNMSRLKATIIFFYFRAYESPSRLRKNSRYSLGTTKLDFGFGLAQTLSS